MTGAVAAAEEAEATASVDEVGKQTGLLIENLFQIVNPWIVALIVGIMLLSGPLCVMVAAKIAFSPARLFVQTVKYYLFCMLGAIALVIGFILLVALQSLIVVPSLRYVSAFIFVILFLAAVTYLLIGLPAQVYEGSWFQGLGFFIVYLGLNAGVGFLNAKMNEGYFNEERTEQLATLFKDYKAGLLVEGVDYTVSDAERLATRMAIEQKQQNAQAGNSASRESLQQQYEALQQQYATLDQNDPEAVAEYQEAYDAYTQAVNQLAKSR